jgi:hypothetical protein
MAWLKVSKENILNNGELLEFDYNDKVLDSQ